MSMNTKIFRGALIMLLIAVGAAATGTALAQTSTASYPVAATCSGGGQLCNNVAAINVTTGGVLQAQYISSGAGACSSIRIHWLVDGTEVAVTGFVAPAGSSGFSNLGPVSAGPHVLGLQAEGQVGGCNVGTLGSWDGTAQVTTSSLAPVSAPALGEQGLMLLMILLALGAAFALRSRRTTAR
jgi:hypothetical protein